MGGCAGGGRLKYEATFGEVQVNFRSGPLPLSFFVSCESIDAPLPLSAVGADAAAARRCGACVARCAVSCCAVLCLPHLA